MSTPPFRPNDFNSNPFGCNDADELIKGGESIKWDEHIQAMAAEKARPDVAAFVYRVTQRLHEFIVTQAKHDVSYWIQDVPGAHMVTVTLHRHTTQVVSLARDIDYPQIAAAKYSGYESDWAGELWRDFCAGADIKQNGPQT